MVLLCTTTSKHGRIIRSTCDLRGRDNATTIVDCCLSFVAYDFATQRVGFMHPSVQRWFDSKPQSRVLLPCDYLAKTCLTYLMFDVFNVSSEYLNREEGRDLATEHIGPQPFYRYVSQFWGTHTRAAEQESGIQNAALAFLA